MSSSEQSPFLHCLQQLNDDTWAEVLLPKLIEQGSAADVALTCSQLRDLCHQNVETIDLRRLAANADVGALDRWMQLMPAHFPGCTVVKLTLSVESSYVGLQYLLPAIARLPKLKSLQVTMKHKRPHMTPMAMSLCNMRTSLTGLECLVLGLRHSWQATPLCWQELGRFTHLTTLDVQFWEKVEVPFTHDSLAALSTLTSLRELSLRAPSLRAIHVAPGEEASTAAPWLSFLSGTTALTQLCLTVPTVTGLSAVSACVELQALALYGADQDAPALGELEWQAIGQLTKLTALELTNQLEGCTTAACYRALAHLSKLEHVEARQWAPDVLHVFEQLSQLTCIGGTWQQREAGSNRVSASCCQVRELFELSGNVPFEAFPGVTTLALEGYLTLDSVSALTQRLKGLQELWAEPGRTEIPGLEAKLQRTGRLQDRIAAVMSLSALTNLRILGFIPYDNEELTALVAAALLLLSLQLRRLGVLIEQGSTITSMALMHLGRLHGLEQLDLDLLNDTALADPSEASTFLFTVAGVRRVRVQVLTEPRHSALLGVVESNRLLGLPMPAALEVVKLDL